MLLEFWKIIHRKKALIGLSLLILLVLADLASIFFGSEYFNFLTHKEEYGYGFTYEGKFIHHPTIVAFLTGTSNARLGLTLLFPMLACVLLFLYGDNTNTEIKQGYLNIIYTKRGKSIYFMNKIFFSFLFGTIFMAVPLIINFLASYAIFHEGTFFSSLEEYLGTKDEDFGVSQIRNPYFWYVSHALSACVISGFCNMIGTALAFVIRNRGILYPCVFFIWLFNFLNPFGLSLERSIQPFHTEEGFLSFILPLPLLFAITAVVVIVSGIIVRRKDGIFG